MLADKKIMKMKLGAKIKKIRELKGITAKDMAAELGITPTGYSKIERDDVDINTEKLEKISKKLGIEPYEILTFDEKIVLHFSNNSNNDNGNFGVFNTVNFSEDIKSLYEDKIKLLQEKNTFLEEKIKYANEALARLVAENELLKANVK